MKSKLDVIKEANPTLEIQLYLKDIAQSDPDIPMVITTGTYDPQTQKAVSEFQRKYNLPITGKVDFATWNEIIKEYDESIHKIKSPGSVFCFPQNINEYKNGDECNLICILQIILKNYHNKYKNYSNVELTGIFDEQTETAIKEFQKRSNLPITGKLDRKTWNILNKINETCKLYE